MGTLNGKASTPTGDPKAPSWPNDPTRETGKVEAWSHGGGAPWQSATFDIDTNTIVIGAGNPAPWNTWARTAPGRRPAQLGQPVYLRAGLRRCGHRRTQGLLPAHAQRRLGLLGQQRFILFEYKDPKTGKLVKAGAHADRNGFFFVTDREKLAARADYLNKPTALINAWPFVDGITWAKGFDLATGRPIETGNRPPPVADGQGKGRHTVFVSPPFLGGKNWNPMADSPDTGLFYIPANHWAMDYWAEKLQYKAGSAYLGQGFRIKRLFNDHVGTLRAMDPLTGKIVWEHRRPSRSAAPSPPGGGLVFTGTSDGYVKALDSRNGKGALEVPDRLRHHFQSDHLGDGRRASSPSSPATAAPCRCGAATWPS